MDLASFYRGRRVLVTGHTGFKGGWLSLWLQEMGAQVTGLALPPPTTPSFFDALAVGSRVQSVLGDIRDRPLLERVFHQARPEVVFHLAAQALVGASYRDPYETHSVNILGTASVLEACRACPPTRGTVVVTSDKCYENQGWDWGYRESDPMGGRDPYSASKGCAEIVVSSYRRSFFQPQGKGLASARAGNVVGGGDFADGRLVPDCYRAFARGRSVALRYPESVRPWQHVLEPLAGYLLLGLRVHQEPQRWSEGWNFGPDPEGSRTVREVVEICARTWGQAQPWVQEPGDHPHEAALLRLDATRARQRLGWSPRWDLETTLGHTMAWYRAFTEGGDLEGLTLGQLREYGAAPGGPTPAGAP